MCGHCWGKNLDKWLETEIYERRLEQFESKQTLKTTLRAQMSHNIILTFTILPMLDILVTELRTEGRERTEEKTSAETEGMCRETQNRQNEVG